MAQPVVDEELGVAARQQVDKALSADGLRGRRRAPLGPPAPSRRGTGEFAVGVHRDGLPAPPLHARRGSQAVRGSNPLTPPCTREITEPVLSLRR